MDLQFRQLAEEDWPFVLRHLPGLKRVEDTTGIVAADAGNVVAVVVMDTWTHNAVCVHQILLSPMVLRHGFFEEVADYVFNVAERNVMIGLVPANNERALRLNATIGFTEVGRVPDAVLDGLDLVVLHMPKENCRFWSAQPDPTLEAVETAAGG